MDVGVIRFAVPAEWVATMGGSCVIQPAPGVVLLTFLMPYLGCDASNTPLPQDRLVLGVADGDPPTSAPNAHVGSFDAWQLADDTMPTYRLTNGIEVAVTGPDSSQIPASFTDAGAVRILQSGPMAPTDNWNRVDVAGVSMLVPPDWQVKDLAHQDTSQGFFPDPGADQGAWFYNEIPRVFVNEADPNITTGGLAVDRWPIDAVDGVWAHEIINDATDIGPVVANGTVSGLDISVIERTLPGNDSIDPVLDLIIRSSGHVVRVSIGVGPDTSITRAILHSLHSE